MQSVRGFVLGFRVLRVVRIGMLRMVRVVVSGVVVRIRRVVVRLFLLVVRNGG